MMYYVVDRTGKVLVEGSKHFCCAWVFAHFTTTDCRSKLIKVIKKEVEND